MRKRLGSLKLTRNHQYCNKKKFSKFSQKRQKTLKKRQKSLKKYEKY